MDVIVSIADASACNTREGGFANSRLNRIYGYTIPIPARLERYQDLITFPILLYSSICAVSRSQVHWKWEILLKKLEVLYEQERHSAEFRSNSQILFINGGVPTTTVRRLRSTHSPTGFAPEEPPRVVGLPELLTGMLNITFSKFSYCPVVSLL